MPTSPRRRFVGSRTLTTSLALAASVALAAAPLASAQSTTQADGTIAVSSLGSSNNAGSLSGSLGSLAQPAYADYVALGDSYGAFGDQRKLKTGEVATACGRSTTNYPTILDANPAVGELTDVTCGGAKIPNLAGLQTAAPPQFDALNAGTDLVTLSIGGNDVGFTNIVGCVTEAPGAPADCRAALEATVETAIDTVFGKDGAIDDVYDAIDKASPNAMVVATQYLPLMPANDEDGCDYTEDLNPDNVQWAREITTKINAAVSQAAIRNEHISVLPTSNTDRSACAGIAERWTSFEAEGPTGAAAFHPTPLGQQAMADAIAAVL